MDMPTDHNGHRQRLKLRFKAQLAGGKPLEERELCELLLTYSIPRRDVAPAARELLQRYGSVENALQAPSAELASVPGISDSTAQFLKLVGVVKGSPGASPVCLPSLASAAEHCRTLLDGMGEECLLQVLLGEDSRVLSTSFVSGGVRDEVALPVGVIIKNALMANARGVVLAHNHPSGDSRPSPADVAATKQAALLLRQSGVRLMEHFVVTGSACFAMLHELEL